ncbi:glycosyltransferase [Streptomyces sp. NBC_01429]|uniref:glycosyltransferase n=1 Tax=Streptomyces sp. NBC_01429 TaxID=2903862 RepID=UPI002E2BBF7D|nr:glycosyltransferase [Streptomyces sp. NBC_01429]
MRIGLLTDGGYPYATGESRLWCDRLVRGLAPHEFDIYALSRSAQQEAHGWIQLPPQVGRVRTAPLWAPADDGHCYGRRHRRTFAAHFAELAAAVCSARADDPAPDAPGSAAATAADRFAAGLYGLADLARERGGLYAALRSEAAVRLLESACRAPGARRSVQSANVPDFLAFADQLERALRPLSLDWYGDDDLAAVDLCHAASGGSAALPGLLAKRFFGVPLLVTEYGVRLRAHYLATSAPADGGAPTAGAPGGGGPGGGGPGRGGPGAGDGRAEASTDLRTPVRTPVRALLASFHGLLAAEVYRQAGVITPGNAHARRWQERCGADRAKLRTVYPGMEARRFDGVGDGADGKGAGDGGGDPTTLVWVGRIEPGKDLISLLHAFAEIRAAEPDARLRIVGAPVVGPEAAAYLAHCQGLAAHLFPDEAADAHAVGDNPVSFEEIGGPEAPDLPAVYAAAGVVVLSSVVEGFPISLVEAMFCARATVSTDVGAVVEVIGGTGLVVPPRNPRALADACVALLRDSERRARLGAAARARALELFTVEQNLTAFRALYLELISRAPVRRGAEAVDADGEPLLFAHPPETYVPGPWTAGSRAPAVRADRDRPTEEAA